MCWRFYKPGQVIQTQDFFLVVTDETCPMRVEARMSRFTIRCCFYSSLIFSVTNIHVSKRVAAPQIFGKSYIITYVVECIKENVQRTYVAESNKYIVANSPLALRWMRDSLRTGSARRKTHTHVAWTSNNRVISSCYLYCCLLPQCEALRTCRSGFPVATKWRYDQDVEVVRSSAFTQRTCDRCGSL